LLYMSINLSWNISLILLMKHGSAVFMFMGITASVPLASLAFALPLPLIGSATFSIWIIVGLSMILSGLVSFRLFKLLNTHVDLGDDVVEIKEATEIEVPADVEEAAEESRPILSTEDGLKSPPEDVADPYERFRSNESTGM